MSIAAIRDFAAEALDGQRYTRLGPDWSIAVADVIGSTKLAGTGRHRDVNFVAGAAVAVMSAAFAEAGGGACVQFGGDGAIGAVPPGRTAAARAVLAALAHWSIHVIDVPIRVGLVSVAELEAKGLAVEAALQDLGGGNHFGLFLGAGVPEAERWVKSDPARQIAPAPGPLPGLDELSCRWHPIPAQRGEILCIIVDPVSSGAAGAAALSALQREIEAVVPTVQAAPLGQGERLKPNWPSWHSLRLECRVVPPGRRIERIIRAVVGTLIILIADRLGTRIGIVDADRYRRDFALRTDYRKAAGGTRFVLDVTPGEAASIEALLEREVAEGRIRYGLARSEATTVTCLVGDFAADRHVHFVDGQDLGFWRAASALKTRFGVG